MKKSPKRLPSIEEKLGLSQGIFTNTQEGFQEFTSQAERVVREANQTRTVNGKTFYYLQSVENSKNGIVVIVKDGKLQSMMVSNPKSFSKMQ